MMQVQCYDSCNFQCPLLWQDAEQAPSREKGRTSGTAEGVLDSPLPVCHSQPKPKTTDQEGVRFVCEILCDALVGLSSLVIQGTRTSLPVRHHIEMAHYQNPKQRQTSACTVLSYSQLQIAVDYNCIVQNGNINGSEPRQNDHSYFLMK